MAAILRRMLVSIFPLMLMLKDVSGGVCYHKYNERKGKCKRIVSWSSVDRRVNIKKYSYHDCCRLPGANGWKDNRKDTHCIKCVKVLDGNWGQWKSWSVCSVKCDWGKRTRTRKCDNPQPSHGGHECAGAPRASKACFSGVRCPIDGKWSSWGNWTACSRTCTQGIHFRYRACNSPAPQFGGQDCSGSSETGEKCIKNKECPINGDWGEWSAWSTCSKTCGIGRMSRGRKCDHPEPKYGGNPCEGKSNGTNPCQLEARCPVRRTKKPRRKCKTVKTGSVKTGSGDDEGSGQPTDQESGDQSGSGECECIGSGIGSGDGVDVGSGECETDTLLVTNANKTETKTITTVRPQINTRKQTASETITTGDSITTGEPIKTREPIKTSKPINPGPGSGSGSGSGDIEKGDAKGDDDSEKGDVDEVTSNASSGLKPTKITDKTISGSGNGSDDVEPGSDDVEPVMVEKGDDPGEIKPTAKGKRSKGKEGQSADEFVVIKS